MGGGDPGIGIEPSNPAHGWVVFDLLFYSLLFIIHYYSFHSLFILLLIQLINSFNDKH